MPVPCLAGLNDVGPPSACSIQSQPSFDFCSSPTPSQVAAQGQGDPFQTPKDNSPFPDTDLINAFSSSTGKQTACSTFALKKSKNRAELC